VRHDAPKDTIAAAIAKRSAVALEEAAAEVGAIVGAVRRSEEWERHPQAAAVGAMPLIAVAHAPGAPAAPWTPGGTTPLAGVRVLDLTRVLAGPVATRNLAFAGAAVLRVDSPRLPEADWIHLDTGAGKRSTLLDLAAPDDRRTFEELLDQAHVVVTGYRPESLDPFGLSADALTERRPGIVVASVSAWGAEGPWGTRRGFDSIVQAVTGIAWLESTDGEAPGALPAQVLDHSAGHLLTAAILESLHRQRRDGGTWEVRVALAPIARALIALPRSATTGASGHTPALQTGRTGAGEITCAAPPMTYAGGPARYPSVARSWGADAAVWP
jgi:crotonobetainyl-CoA:carnitine CoA-transferase CaiB-like acyl-CoA transferase